ncbi:MAG: hypothetical protein COX57_12590 [Alphaproteobacteria bacterium CG_4_10_14_0_2_um_filter_63_37]|nr:MAG: hypothetical protein AUJ55_11750 [Proteobacteria bacterium CG1_02_64_396]PJA23648.1 MAG: hypothetical protein COX57_12590 [Alphaproteobacteria bacterium CG_4_10_14_0_2_um_filter_63_37]
MFGLNMLDVMIGLITIYLVFGIVCTAIVEWFNQLFSVRSNNLETALKEMFAGDLNDQQSFVAAFYAHPLIRSLCTQDAKGNVKKPSYIPSDVVGKVVESLLLANKAVHAAKKVEEGGVSLVDALPDTKASAHLKQMVAHHVDQARGDAEAFRQSVADQFDQVMDRASGWFKRKTQVVGFWTAAILVVVGNVDTLQITQVLANNPAARAQMMAVANQVNVQGIDDQPGVGIAFEQAQQAMAASTLQFGWHPSPAAPSQGWLACLGAVLTKIVGLLISAMAISLGAPFWFDMLQKVMKVRTSISPRDAKQPVAPKTGG